MSCQRFNDAIVDHACGAALDGSAAAHLKQCPRCRRIFDDVRSQLAGAEAELREALAVSASPDFVSRALIRARAVTQTRSWSSEWSMGLAAAATIAVAVYVAAPGPPPDPQRAHVSGASQSVNLPVETPPLISTPAVSSSVARRAAADRRRVAPTAQGHERNTAEEPVVIVPLDQARAIARLRELLRSGALDEAGVPVAASVPDEVLVAPLAIPELQIPDLQTILTPPSSGAEDRR